MSDRLDKLAQAHGIELGYKSEWGDWRDTPESAKRKVLVALGIPAATDEQVIASLALERADPAPSTQGRRSAFWPEWMVSSRAFGLACQLYSVTSSRNWGIGDFEDLARLAEIAAPLGADFIGVSPLHALFTAEPGRISPYAPSSRSFLNPLFIAPDRVPGFAALARELPGLPAELAAVRAGEFINYPAVAALKLQVLALLSDHFRAADDAEAVAERDAFKRFCKARGPALTRFCLYEALAEHFVAQGGYAAWSTWPDGYRSLDTREVRSFARGAKPRIEFHAWLQWLADRQLAEAQARARGAGMRIGLYLDLAVGVSPDGAAAWASGGDVAATARIGAPPDIWSADGQNWGLVPLSPEACHDTAPAFREVLRANMRHAGALRLDHVMGLQRLYWIPESDPASHGAYVRYPFECLLRAMAEESWRKRCMVVGEDLGTLPYGFTDQIVQAGMLSYQVLYFARRQDAGFVEPEGYRREALCCVSTHDLPTLQGWWTGRDIAWRLSTGRASEQDASRQLDERARDRLLLLGALAAKWLLPAHYLGILHGSEAMPDRLPEDLIVAVHRYLARTESRLFAVQIEDALGLIEQANLPGTIDEHPNWQRKLPVALEELAAQPILVAIAAAAAEESRTR